MLESLLAMLTKRRSQAFCKVTDVHYVTNVVAERIYSVRMWNIVNQLDKHDFSCG